jgi:dihydrofolate synthase/folylpolyglutamate synthase
VDYTSALHHVLSLADLERMADPPGTRPRYDLSRMQSFMHLLGDSQRGLPTVHVTGTKGKGSTSAMIASILNSCGFSVGLYTSPHLHTMRERIQLDGKPLSEEAFAAAVDHVWPTVDAMAGADSPEHVTTFETLTAMAFSVFAERKADFQVLEVGMGGTLDATNLVEDPLVCVITSISLDHTAILGDTVEEIARDKAGIIKPGATVVTAPQSPGVIAILEEACSNAGATLVNIAEAYSWQGGEWSLKGQDFVVDGPRGRWQGWLPLLGKHQLENAVCAVAAAEALIERGIALPQQAALDGLEKVYWPGRLEVLQENPLVVVDGAHNPYSTQQLVQAVQRHFPMERCILLFGVSQGHDLTGIVAALTELAPAAVIATTSRHPRSVPIDRLMKEFQHAGLPVQWGGEVSKGLEQAKEMAVPGDLILATGSLFTAVEVREQLKGIPPEEYPEFQDVRFSSKVR